MKRLLALTSTIAVLILPSQLVAYESLLGVLTSTGASVNQTTTGTTFSLSGAYLAIQCDAAACVRVGSGSATAASCSASSSSLGVQVAAGQLYDIPMASVGGNAVDTIAMISVTGTANCAVFRVVSGP